MSGLALSGLMMEVDMRLQKIALTLKQLMMMPATKFLCPGKYDHAHTSGKK